MIQITGTISQNANLHITDLVDDAIGRDRFAAWPVAVTDEITDESTTIEISAATGACGEQIVLGHYSLSYPEAVAFAAALGNAIDALSQVEPKSALS